MAYNPVEKIPGVNELAQMFGLTKSNAEYAAERAAAEREAAYRQQLAGLEAPRLAPLTDRYGNIVADPQAVRAQRAALNYLLQIGATQGLSPQDRLALSEIQQTQAQTERGAREALLSGAASRGQLGTGDLLASQLMGGQAAAQTAYLAGTQVQADAQRRALEAMTGAAGLGGQMRSAGYDEAMRRAQAQTEVERLNRALQSENFATRLDLAKTKYGAQTGNTAAVLESAERQATRDAAMRQWAVDTGMTIATGLPGSTDYTKKPGSASGGYSGGSSGASYGGSYAG